MALGTFISVGRSLDTALERVQLAEKLGYESVYVTHIASRDSLTTLMAYASRTERVRLGTGVMPIYSRPPVTTAMSAATADEFSGGRIVLGLGSRTGRSWRAGSTRGSTSRCARCAST